ncbi:MAG TPA: amino acid adenylation domain-containing protein, partial [Pseudoxanthomonas sp.]|nr:amino acid adenylation domain-containing protein [Pseudoxanthomonas sp.]
RANQVAHRLIALGVRPDDRVAICADRGTAMLVSILGVWKSGGGYVPLDPSYPLDRLAYMLSDSSPKAVVTTVAELSALPMLSEAGVPVVVADDGSLSEQATACPQVDGLGPRSLAYVIYTSGSTGQPKGVMVEHRSPVNFWQVMRETTHAELKPRSRVALNAAFSFDMSLKGILQLLSGHCVLPVPQSIRASGAEMVSFLETQSIDAMDSTPSQLQVLLDAGLLEGAGHRPVSIYLGGEPVGRKLWETLKASPRIHFHNMYGPTECTVDATIGSIRHSAGGPVIGKPVMNVAVYLLDANLEPVPVGVPGELYLGGVQVARGYLDREALTAERFVRDPFSGEADARMYKTGDLGRWLPDGTIEYIGRNDFQVKIRGFRIELGEIESRLSKLDGVREAVVIAREDVEGDKRLVAYVVPVEGATLEIGSLREGLSKDLAEYMIPSAFVLLGSLPLTPNGKLDRKALPAPDGSAVASRSYEAPVGEVEESIAAIWCELLNLERVGRNDHFFELGGHSLLVMQLVLRVREQFDIDLPLRELFEKPLLSAVAEVVHAQMMATFMGDELEGMQDELDGLSEEELRQLLEKESVDG